LKNKYFRRRRRTGENAAVPVINAAVPVRNAAVPVMIRI
jgi:hypothetical protein